MLKYFCECPHDAAITINFILLFFNCISNLLLILKYFLRVLFKKLFWVINLLILLPKWIRRAPALSICKIQFSSFQLLSHVQLFATPWNIACQASITNSQSLFISMSIESVMPSKHFILCHPFILLPSIFQSIRVFLVSQLFPLGGQSIGVSVSASVLPRNIQD